MKNKGFTLIELLAVIVILAIIALIAVPIILNIINDARTEADEMSKELYLTAVENEVARKNLTEEFKPDTCEVDDTGNLTCIIDDKEVKLSIEVNGTRPTGGTIEFMDNMIDYYTLIINGKTYTHSYVQDGLVLWLDGISNTRDGHDENTTVWEDLSGNNNDATLINYDNPEWDINSLNFNGINQYAQILNQTNIPEGESPYTIEVVFKANEINNGGLLNLGVEGAGGLANGFRLYRNVGFRHYYWHSDLDYRVQLNIDTIYTAVALNYGSERRIYLNSEFGIKGSAVPNVKLGSIVLGRCSEGFLNGNIYSIRVYNRGLSDEEIKKNFEVDKKRFGIIE